MLKSQMDPYFLVVPGQCIAYVAGYDQGVKMKTDRSRGVPKTQNGTDKILVLAHSCSKLLGCLPNGLSFFMTGQKFWFFSA